MMILFIVLVLAVSGLAFWAYQESLRRHEERVIARYEESQREQERRRKAALGMTQETPAAAGRSAEIDGVPVEVFEAECADVLAQLAQRRREMRRPVRRPTTRRAAATD